jgi:energy-coupling factor transporter ATP-binding protein EcfA2
MADEPYLLRTLSLAGFRAYLRPKTFDFGKKRCLVIFAPNGSGKTGVIDALEFIFSKDGTLNRLGQRAINNQAGPAALVHNRAAEAEITPSIPDTVTACFVVDPIIRGHALRAFVDDHPAEQRYSDVATWLQLAPLVEVQKNLRALRSQIKAAAEDAGAIQRVNMQVRKETSQAVVECDDEAILAYINAALLTPLDSTLTLKALTVTDPRYVALTQRLQSEERQVGLAGLRQIRQAVGALWADHQDVKAAPGRFDRRHS